MILDNLSSAVNMYKTIENDFINNIEQQYGLKFNRYKVNLESYIPRAKSEHINFKSPACIACEKGIDSYTDFLSLKCNKDCFFCFNPNQTDYEASQLSIKKGAILANNIIKNNPAIENVAITGGEPLLHKKEVIDFFRKINDHSKSVYKRLYTNGSLVNKLILKELQSCNLQEIRFSIKIDDPAEDQAEILEKIEEATNYIPNVMVEMPVIPNTYLQMVNILNHLENIGIRGVNLLEFSFPLCNEKEFMKRGYLLKYPPFEVYYDYWYAGGLAIAGSEHESLQLLDYAKKNNFKMGIHYCSLSNKHLGQVYQQNIAYPIDKWLYLSDKDYFLKSVKVYGEDILETEKVLKKNNVIDYNKNIEYNFLEFHPSQINLFKDLNIEIGLSYQVIEKKDGNVVARELKVEKVENKTEFII